MKDTDNDIDFEKLLAEFAPYIAKSVSTKEEIQQSKKNETLRFTLTLNQIRKLAEHLRRKHNISIYLQADLLGKSFEEDIKQIKEEIAKASLKKSVAYIWTGGELDPNAKPDTRMIIITPEGMIIEPFQYATGNLPLRNVGTCIATTEFPSFIPHRSAVPALDPSISATLCLTYAKEYLKDGEAGLKNSFFVPYDTDNRDNSLNEIIEQDDVDISLVNVLDEDNANLTPNRVLDRNKATITDKNVPEFKKYFLIPPHQMFRLVESRLYSNILQWLISSDQAFETGNIENNAVTITGMDDKTISLAFGELGKQGYYVKPKVKYKTNNENDKYLVEPIIKWLMNEQKAAMEAGKTQLAASLLDTLGDFTAFREIWLMYYPADIAEARKKEKHLGGLPFNTTMVQKSCNYYLNAETKVTIEAEEILREIEEKIILSLDMKGIINSYSDHIKALKFSDVFQLGHFLRKFINIILGRKDRMDSEYYSINVEDQTPEPIKKAIQLYLSKDPVGDFMLLLETLFENKTNLALIDAPDQYKLLMFSLKQKNNLLQLVTNHFFQRLHNFHALQVSAREQEENLQPIDQVVKILDWIDVIEVAEEHKVFLIKQVIGLKFQENLIKWLGKDNTSFPSHLTKYFKNKTDVVNFLTRFISQETLTKNFYDILDNASEMFNTEEEFFLFCKNTLSPELLISKLSQLKEDSHILNYLISYFKCVPAKNRTQTIIKELSPTSEISIWLQKTIKNWASFIVQLLNNECSPLQIEHYLNDSDNSFFINLIQTPNLSTLINNSKTLKEVLMKIKFFEHDSTNSSRLPVYKDIFRNLKSNEGTSEIRLEQLFCLLKLLPATYREELIKEIIQTKDNKKVFLTHLNKYLINETPENQENMLVDLLGPEHKLILAYLKNNNSTKNESSLPMVPNHSQLRQGLIFVPRNFKEDPSIHSTSDKSDVKFEKKLSKIEQKLLEDLQTYIKENEFPRNGGKNAKSLEGFWEPNRVKTNFYLAKELVCKLEKGEHNFLKILCEALETMQKMSKCSRHLLANRSMCSSRLNAILKNALISHKSDLKNAEINLKNHPIMPKL